LSTAKYQHLVFQKHWQIGPDAHYELGQCEAIIETIQEMPLTPDEHERLLQVALVKGARATTAIEGNTLSDEEVHQVSEGLRLPPSRRYQEIEVRNVLNAMNGIFDEVVAAGRGEIVSPKLLRNFHEMIGRDLGEHFDAVPGRFRTDARSVGTYRCPDPREVPGLVDRLCGWLPAEFGYVTGEQPFRDAVVQAIVTHVYIEWIHPFGDGNGRAGRLVEFYVLLRAGNPDIASHILSNFYNLTRPEYYRQLDLAGRTGDLSKFIRYAIQGFRDGLKGVVGEVHEDLLKIAWKNFIYDTFAEVKYRKSNVFKRRRSLALRLPPGKPLTLSEIPDASPELAREYASLSSFTLARDLDQLRELRLVTRDGDRYVANVSSLTQRTARRLRR
jgi:Fic family protein